MTLAKRAPRLDLNPSSADRWVTCTASPKFILDNWDRVPPQDTGFSKEGTTAHEVAAALLENRNPNPEECPTPIDGDMQWHAWNYVEYIQGLLKPGATLTVEKKLPLWYMPERNAKIDVAVWNTSNLHIVDYKYGAGIIVSPHENLQGAIYARCTVEVSKRLLVASFPISIHIYQPRARESAEAHKVWETTWGELKRMTDLVISKPAKDILAAQSYKETLVIAKMGQDIPDDDFVEDSCAGDKLQFRPSPKACQWCPAKGFCTERLKHLTVDIDALTEFENLGPTEKLPEISTISLEQYAAILTHKAQIIKWLDDAEECATALMRSGTKIPGHKLVLSRGGNRKWTDPKKAAELLVKTTILRKDEVIVEKTITPAEAEKRVGKLNVDLLALVDKTLGVPKIAPESDKRPEYGVIEAASEFEVLPEDFDEFEALAEPQD